MSNYVYIMKSRRAYYSSYFDNGLEYKNQCIFINNILLTLWVLLVNELETEIKTKPLNNENDKVIHGS